MEKTRQVVTWVGKVILALLAGVLMPIWIWVALGVIVNQKLHERSAQRKPAPTIGEILAAAGLSIQSEATQDETIASKVFAQQPVSDIHGLLTRAGLSIHEEPVFKHYIEKTKEIVKGIGKVVLALVGGVLMPIWIWVALGVAISQKLREKEAERQLAPTTGKILPANHIPIQHKK